MKAPRIPAPLHELTPALLCANTITQHREILATWTAPNKLLKAERAKREHPNKLLKTQGDTKKDVKNEGTSQYLIEKKWEKWNLPISY